MSENSVLVQTRVTKEDSRWLHDAAYRQGLSAASLLRRMVAEARMNEKVAFDAAALEARFLERVRQLESRVEDLERASPGPVYGPTSSSARAFQ